ncbi:polyprenyl synthetase family protein [Paenibacillus kobensis]|uniref:polyprenyl synthetase family protein n=1 Tax=Paenibacillus kobensis TaxID=59841 RepID=UPI000FDB0503|nr:polyprenyl synthetase family protein [Paenibacillus kobensis]
MNAENEERIVQPDACYRLAEQKASHYFDSLFEQVRSKTYVAALTEDIGQWQRKHIYRRPWLSWLGRGSKPSNTGDYNRYIRWLQLTNKLDDYIDRSIRYIYMRDLGAAMDSPHTRSRMQRIAADIKRRLVDSADAGRGGAPSFISVADFYQWAQKEGVENAAIWVLEKLKDVSAHIPEGMNAEHAQRKLIKIILGVVLHVVEELGDHEAPAERSRRLDEAIRLGYSYGLTYPFIDDLLDAQVLTAEEKARYSGVIRTALLNGTVPELGEWNVSDNVMFRYIQLELSEAFEYIKRHQLPEERQLFFEQAFVFFHSQELDRAKDLSHATYTNEELFIPVILKSASSRLIARSVIRAPLEEGFENRTFYYGIYNQLADDFADLFDDMADGAVTPFTYYYQCREQRPDLINPFELYWAVIYYLIHHVYRSDADTREVILNRAINGLKRCKARIGTAEYNRMMDIFAAGNPEFNRLVQRMVDRADDVDFLDKLLRDQLVQVLRNDRTLQDQFKETVGTARDQINRTLRVAMPAGIPEMDEKLIDAANYSLEGDGKRLRPVLAWVMGVEVYGLQAETIVPLLRSLEYMHTASLIFDDLPSQDNASTRRGRTTLHQLHNSATAELTGLLLIQRAIQEQASLTAFDAVNVLSLIQYSAQKAEVLCMGQEMDLSSKGRTLTLEQLNTICYCKTGIAFEAALVMPAILAKIDEQEIAVLKRYAYHAGIAFQIKDDLLDAEGDEQLMGKPVGKDAENNTSTFVTILGQSGAKKEMWQHYCLAVEALKELPRPVEFLKHLLNYMVYRDR